VKILHVISYFGIEFGGPPVNVVNMAAHMKARGIISGIITTKKMNKAITNSYIEHTADAVTVRIPITYCRSFEDRYLRFSPAFASRFRSIVNDYDIVLIHGLWQFPVSYAARHCFQRGIPYIVLSHAMLSKYSFHQKYIKKQIYFQLFEKKNLNCANAVIYMDEQEKEYAISRLGIVNRSYLLFNALNQEDLLKSIVSQKASDDMLQREEKFNILFLSRVHSKNLEITLSLQCQDIR